MQLLLGLFFFSTLLTTGSSIQCVNCVAVNGYCSGVKEECPSGSEACLSLLLQAKVKTHEDIDPSAIQVFIKHCTIEKECKKYESLIGKSIPISLPFISDGVVIKEITCSRAPPSFASFFPAFLGLLLMKLLF